MSDNMLKIRGLYVDYHTDEATIHALNGFDLDLQKGEILGLVGETGAGKTTMALSILRLLPNGIGRIVSGLIEYNGIDILSASNEQMRQLRGAGISMIFQDPMTSLNPIIPVWKQVKEVLDLHFPEMSDLEKEEQVNGMFKMVGLPWDRKDDYPHQLSGGMKQRIVIAMALISEPKLLLADEPTTALDVTIQAQILELMRELKARYDSAMIYITHDLGVINEFCNNVAVVYAGSVIESGSVEQVFTSGKNHPYTDGLFKCIPDLYTDTERLIPIPGYMVDPSNIPPGCKFADRCIHCMGICKVEEPAMHPAGDHLIKCHLFTVQKGNEI